MRNIHKYHKVSNHSKTQNNNNAHSTATVYASSPPPGAIFQPYPYIMNPPYPINGPPYSQHPQFPPQAPQQINTAAPPHGHQYAYPMHPSHYPPYTPYPQYQPMVMYSTAPRPSAPPEISYPPPSPAANNAGGKRKRKPFADSSRSGKGASDEEGPSGSDVGRGQPVQQQTQAQALSDLKKRTKTVRVHFHFYLHPQFNLDTSSSVPVTRAVVEKLDVIF